MANNYRVVSDEILECILPYVQDPRDRASISVVCRQCYELDRLTRRHVTMALCYTSTPQRLRNRFPNIESLKLKGKPRAAMFNLIPEDWGGYVKPWVDSFGTFTRLNALHFRRMIISDADLETIAIVKGRTLHTLKLDKCSGFTSDGLLPICRSCKNLKTLFLEDSTLTSETSGEWFHQLALNNTVLETLNFYMTFLEKIRVEDLELLARNCPLISVKIGDIDLVQLVNFFRSATRLQEFCGGSVSEFEQYSNITFPAKMTSVGLMFLGQTQIPILFPVAELLRKLDLVYASLSCMGHCELISRCPNLEVLETTDVIGDQGLEVVSLTCKRVKRLRIERGADEQGLGVESGSVTQRGLIAVAQGCRLLEYLAVYVSDITNEALEHIGANLKDLNDFRLVLLDREETISGLPLDTGVRALLQGCQNMRRFALYLRQGGLTDTGLGYIGELSGNVRWMLLGFVGETDAGLLEFSKGCPSLVKLEMRACCFTEMALAIAATRLRLLRYMWVQGYRASQAGFVHLLQMVRPYWNIEIIPGDQYDANGDNGDQPVRVDHPSHILAYYSLAGVRTDHPPTVYCLPQPEEPLEN